MGEENHKFEHPETARAYIRSLAFNFLDPEDLYEFLSACDIAQAALAHWMLTETKYTGNRQVNCEEKHNCKETDHCFDRHKALLEFELAKEKLKQVINKLNITNTI